MHETEPSARKPRTAIDLAALRAQLAERHGKEYWRSLEELAGAPEFDEFLKAEFPEQAPDLLDPVGRPMWLSTNTPVATPASGMAVAK